MFSLLLIIHYNWIVIQNLEVNFLFPKLKFGPTFVNLTDVHKTSLINCSFSICIWKMAEGKTLSLPPSMAQPKLQLFKDQLLMQKSRRQAEKIIYN